MVDLNKLYERDEDAALENYAAGLQTTPEGYPYYQNEDNKLAGFVHEYKPGWDAQLEEEQKKKNRTLFENEKEIAKNWKSDSLAKIAVELPQNLVGLGAGERDQLWPEKLARSAISLPTDVMSGRVATGVGLRKESYTDNPDAPEPLAPLIERAQDMSALATGAPLAMKPGTASLGSGMNRTIYRGEYSGNKGGKFWSTDPEFAQQFTQTGQAHEVMKRTIAEKDIYKPDKSIYAGDVDAVDQALLEAKKGGFKAVELNEGHNQPNSVLFLSDNEAGTALTAVAKSQAPTFFSSLEQAVKNSKMNSGTAEQWTGYLRNQPGVKAEELAYSGLENLPKGQISKAEIEKHVGENSVSLGETWKGTPDEAIAKGRAKAESLGVNWDNLSRIDQSVYLDRPDTKYHSYQLPGGENYKELLLTLPKRANKEGLPEGYQLVNSNEEAKAKGFNVPANTPERWEFRGPGISSQIFKTRDEAIAGAHKAADSMGNAGTFKSSHWSEPNILAHVRMNDRDIPNVGKSLHIEELQSDWHQKGRKEGYKFKNDKEHLIAEERFNKLDDKLLASGDDAVMGTPVIEDAIKAAVEKKILTLAEGAEYMKYDMATRFNAVPDAPFKTTWSDVAIKRMIREASEKGYDAISWTPGEAQAARYDLSKQVDRVEYNSQGELQAYKNNKLVMHERSVPKEKLADYIGKEPAEKLLNKADVEGVKGLKSIEGLDLKIGGEGMKGFYDKMMVDKVNAIAKKFGGKVEQQTVPGNKKVKIRQATDTGGGWEVVDDAGKVLHATNGVEGARSFAADYGSQKIHILKLPPDLKKHALEKGFPLFTGGPTLIPIDHNPFGEDKKKYRLVPVPGNPFNE